MTAALSEPELGPGRQEPWTVDELMRLPEGNWRYELVEGALVMTPAPKPAHQKVAGRLYRLIEDCAVEAAAPVDVYETLGIRLAKDTVVIPDLVVVRADAPSLQAALLRPRDVLLVVEVVSPGSTVRDRTEKPYLFAEAGIPHFWRIETTQYRGCTKELPVVIAHELVGDNQYKTTQVAGAGERFCVSDPYPIEFDPLDLLRRFPSRPR